MKVLRIKPMCRPEVIDIDGSLESLQKEVGGLIQATYPWDDKVALICNDEGKLMGLEFNRPLYNADAQMKRKLQLPCWPTRIIAILKPFMFTKK